MRPSLFLVVALLLAAVGCKDECDPAIDLAHCEGDTLVYCAEPGVDQIVNPVNRWSRRDCLADQICFEPEAGRALCALSAEPAAACAGEASWACESATSHVYCQEGYATARSACLRCDPQSTTVHCVGGPSSPCAASAECVQGLVCSETGYCRRP